MAKVKAKVFDGVNLDRPAQISSVDLQLSPQAILCHAPVTIFAIPKAFSGDAVLAQRNAIRSWLRLGPAVNVLLFGDEHGIAQFARDNDVAHIGKIERNEKGTPLVSDAFTKAHLASTSPILVYCNADVILDEAFVGAMEELANQDQFDNWLAIGQRTDLRLDREIDYSDAADAQIFQQQCKKHGVLTSSVCKEYFAFNRAMFCDVPAFAVGRGNWDNWMVASAKKNSLPVIDLSRRVKAIHQSHDYSHMRSSRIKCYFSGDEARHNERLAGGRNWVAGTACTHRLTHNGIKAISTLQGAIDFVCDLPRFARLVRQLLLGR